MWILLRWPKMYGGHLRVPEAGLVAEMDAGFQHLTHGYGHAALLYQGWTSTGGLRSGRQ